MSGSRPGWRCFAGLLVLCAGAGVAGQPAHALSIELKDVAPDRIERQRDAEAGRLPLPNTPDVARLEARLSDAGLRAGAPMLIRVFKASSELELWMEKGDRFILFATYPICHWSGTLGPKLKEGDKQTPEGFYTITRRQTRHLGRWRGAINLGFPNVYDQSLGRSGSFILMHGGCSSVGCFAMTDAVMDEIYDLTKAAIARGQRHVPVHVFPFRMTDEAIAARRGAEWHPFWASLKAGYDSFERTRKPPRITVCKKDYYVEDAGTETSIVQRVSGRRSSSQSGPGAIRTACPKPSVANADETAANAAKTADAKAGGQRRYTTR